MLHICCIRAGALFAPAYVNILFDSVRRNLADGFEGEFVCFTDQPDELAKGIEVRPLPADLPGWWSKLALFRPGLFPEGDRVLFLDLDTLITGRLDELAAYNGPFAILRDFYRPEGLQSAVMAWRAGECSEIWEGYQDAGCPTDDPYGDQAWIERTQLNAARLQDAFPGLFVTHKLTNGPPEKAAVVCFHGRPRPHEVEGWVAEVWKVGGLTRAELDTICNTAKEKLIANAVSAIARELPWFDLSDEHDGHVCIVGGGPSLADPHVLRELKLRVSMGQKVWALNGTGRFLYKNGINPDVLVVADARAENVDFLGELNEGVRLLLASQCHPSLFEAATEYGLPVTLWHVNSPGMAELLGDERARPVHLVGGGSTVGLNAMVLATCAGYRTMHLYGFDSSYRNNDHHAYTQVGNNADRIIDALYGDLKFKTTGWMVQQVNEFQDLVPQLAADGCTITVAGDGLLQTVAQSMMGNIPMTPAQIRASEVLKRLNGASHPRGAEIGVFAGEMSAALLKANPILHLDMIDSWEGDGQAYTGDSGDWHAKLAQSTQDSYQEAARARTAFADDRRSIIRARSTEAPVSGEYDFVFLDADHSYEGCKADIAAWAPRIKPGGWLGGHDYANAAFPKFGVTQAVDEFIAAHGLKLELGENYTWFAKREHSWI
jgi:predicted O-methyltransferase YrrM